jgi:hypothetical protein
MKNSPRLSARVGFELPGVAEKLADGGTGDGNYGAQYFEAVAGSRDYDGGENGG